LKPPERVVRELAFEWLAKADVDLSAGRALLAEADLFEVVAFHSQQAVEKSLKAFLVCHQIEFPKTHDVRRLLALCASIDPDLAETLTGAAELTPYGVAYRYPGEYPPVSKEAAGQSLATARFVLGEVAKRLPDQPGRSRDADRRSRGRDGWLHRHHRPRLVLALPAPRRAAGRGRLLAALAERLRAIPPGAPFFFRLGAPHKAIAGYGFFARYERVPVWLAWES
jgi:HEPN domain-containing protein